MRNGGPGKPDPDVRTVLDFLVGDAVQPIQKSPTAGGIFLFGQPGAPKVAAHAAQLYFEGHAPYVIVTGGQSASGVANPDGCRSEAQYYVKILVSLGIPLEDIIIDEDARNTGENVTRGVAAAYVRHVDLRSLILVSVPPHVMRCALTFGAIFPDISVRASIYSFNPDIWCSNESGINRILGELQRILFYGSKHSEDGGIAWVKVPHEVMEAYNRARALYFPGLSGVIHWTDGHLHLDD